jgi:hypothetical protein
MRYTAGWRTLAERLPSEIRFPMNGCMIGSHLGLCLGNLELIDAQLTTKKELNHPAVGSLLADLCRIWWHSLQSVIRLVSASSPRPLRRRRW